MFPDPLSYEILPRPMDCILFTFFTYPHLLPSSFFFFLIVSHLSVLAFIGLAKCFVQGFLLDLMEKNPSKLFG